MKKISVLLFVLISMIMVERSFAQIPNNQRKKPVKKTVAKPVEPLPPAPEPVKEPTLDETKAWVIEKILKYKPIVYVTSNITEKSNCEWQVTDASFDENDLLVLKVKADPASLCYKDRLETVKVDFSLIDAKRTNAVEATKRVLLFPQALTAPFSLSFAPGSPMLKTKFTHFNTIIAFDKGAAYETNLSVRLGKALLKISEFKSSGTQAKEAY